MEKTMNAENQKTIGILKNTCKAFSRLSVHPVFIMDLNRDDFIYMSDDIHFAGYSTKEITETGWKFFIEICTPEKRESLGKALYAARNFYIGLTEDKIYDCSMSFNVPVRVKNTNMIINANHQCTPLYIDKSTDIYIFMVMIFPGFKTQRQTLIIRDNKSGNCRGYYPEEDVWVGFENDTELTGNEKLALTYICSGMSSKMIAYTMNKSIDSINRYRKSIISKLGVNTMHEAVTVAMLHKLI